MRGRNNLRLAFTVIGLRAPLICLSVATSFLQVGSGSRLPGPLTTSIAVASGPSGYLVWSFITGLLRRFFHWWVDCGCATMSGASTGAATAGADTLRDNFIPLFDGKPTSYKEYRQRLLLYQRKMKLQKKPAEATINLLTSLTGIAWRQVEHLAETAPDAEDGFEQVLKALDQAFKYDSRVEMPRSLDKYFYGGARRPDQSLLAYCADHREALREVQKHGIKIPPEVDGYILLRRSGLTNEQKQLIQSQVGANMSASKVEEHMYFLLGQDYKNVSRPRPSMDGTASLDQAHLQEHGIDLRVTPMLLRTSSAMKPGMMSPTTLTMPTLRTRPGKETSRRLKKPRLKQNRPFTKMSPLRKMSILRRHMLHTLMLGSAWLR